MSALQSVARGLYTRDVGAFGNVVRVCGLALHPVRCRGATNSKASCYTIPATVQLALCTLPHDSKLLQPAARLMSDMYTVFTLQIDVLLRPAPFRNVPNALDCAQRSPASCFHVAPPLPGL